MDLDTFHRRGLAYCLIVVLGGCSGFGAASTSELSPPIAATSVAQSNNSGTQLVYVADHSNNLIDVFNLRGVLQHTITTGINAPEGLFVDAGHNLWVANPGAKNVLEFPRGKKTPSATLLDSNRPDDVALCNDGTVFVADSGGKGGIGVYPAGHSHPERRLEPQQSGSFGIEFYVTCDSMGNIFATSFIGLSPFIATVGFKHARESGYYLLNSASWSSSGIKATSWGTLLIAFGSGTFGYVEEFTESGNPTGRQISTSPKIWSDFALNAQEDVIFGTDPTYNVVVGLTFPGDKVKRTYSNSNLVQPVGVAVDPGD